MASRRPLVGGNWKCNGTLKTVSELVDSFNKAKDVPTDKVDVVVSPVNLHIPYVKDKLRKDFHVASQNSYTQSGAFTGEVSSEILADFGISWLILGHSERRQVFGESDNLIGAKAGKAQQDGLNIIACVGETLVERETNKTLEVVTQQLKAYADNVSSWGSQFVIAYEPVWAIGTGKVATPEQAQEVHSAIRKWIKDNVSEKAAQETRILYGGSVKPENSDELFAQPDIDGFLVGGASLKPDFVNIVKSCSK